MGFGVQKLTRPGIILSILPGKWAAVQRVGNYPAGFLREINSSGNYPAKFRPARWPAGKPAGLPAGRLLPAGRPGRLPGRPQPHPPVSGPQIPTVVARRKPCTVCAAYAQSARPSKLGSICCTHRWWWLAVLVRKPDGALQTVGRTKRREVAHLIAP